MKSVTLSTEGKAQAASRPSQGKGTVVVNDAKEPRRTQVKGSIQIFLDDAEDALDADADEEIEFGVTSQHTKSNVKAFLRSSTEASNASTGFTKASTEFTKASTGASGVQFRKVQTAPVVEDTEELPAQPRSGEVTWGLARSKLKRKAFAQVKTLDTSDVSDGLASSFGVGVFSRELSEIVTVQSKMNQIEASRKRNRYESCADMLRHTQPGERTDAQIAALRRLISKGSSMLSSVGDRVLIDICQRLEFKEFEPMTNLFNMGDVATQFFILLKGQVGLYVGTEDEDASTSAVTSPSASASLSKRMSKRQSIGDVSSPTSPSSPAGRSSRASLTSQTSELDEFGEAPAAAALRVKVLKPGEAFGERGLLADELRTATARVVGVESAAVGSLSRENFDKYARQALARGRQEKLEFLRLYIPEGRNAEENRLEHLAYMSYESHHVRGEVLDGMLQPGTVAFVIEGQVDVRVPDSTDANLKGKAGISRPLSAPTLRQAPHNNSELRKSNYNRVISVLERGDAIFGGRIAAIPQIQHVVSSRGLSLLFLQDHDIQWHSWSAFDALQQRVVDRARWHLSRRTDLARVSARAQIEAKKAATASRNACSSKPKCSERTWRFECKHKELHKLLERCESIPTPVRGWKPTELKSGKKADMAFPDLVVIEPMQSSMVYPPPQEVLVDRTTDLAASDMVSNGLADRDSPGDLPIPRLEETQREPEEEGMLVEADRGPEQPDKTSLVQPLSTFSLDDNRSSCSGSAASEVVFVTSNNHEPSPEELHQRVIDKYQSKTNARELAATMEIKSAVGDLQKELPSGLVAKAGRDQSENPVERLLVAINDFQQHTAEQLQKHPRGDHLPYSWVGGRQDVAISSASGHLVRLMTPERTRAEVQRLKMCTDVLKRFQAGSCPDEEILEGLLGAEYVKPTAAEGLFSWGSAPMTAKNKIALKKTMSAADLEKLMREAETPLAAKHDLGLDLRTAGAPRRPSSASLPKSQSATAAPVRRRPASAAAGGRSAPSTGGSHRGLGAEILSLGLPEELAAKGVKVNGAGDRREVPIRSRLARKAKG
eukprot:gnl/MRDRNA2_/MRDRNA2_34468_c0_seq1.p1 gnl/MRDRNA2_/MRDRNA2_34468_c0~~gnl/MRDRNA2_/MRDRNA2_34468_c0_seq1.p1  ORF type:complete len:1061 (-),score=193.82 gnl/MRDRNA2_/MRDRNA2_34468_c0_seq1:106-3288(-)